MTNVIFIGAGGYAKSVLDSLDRSLYNFSGFIDSFKPIGSSHLGYPILANKIEKFTNRQDFSFFISIGDNAHRYNKFTKLKELNCHIINIIDKTALVSQNTQIGKGVFIGKMAIINSDVKIGNNVIINTKALIEHGCTVKAHSNISTNTTLNGDVVVEEHCFVGSSSVITGQLHIKKNSIVGAGAVVIRNVEENTVVAGVPAKLIKEIKNEE